VPLAVPPPDATPATAASSGASSGTSSVQAAPGVPPAPTRVPLAVLAAALGIYALAYMLWVALHHEGAGDVSTATAVSDFASIPMAAAAACLAWWAGHDRRAAPRRRSAWRWIAFGCVSWLVADAMWFYLEAVRHLSPFPSPADAFYLAFYVLVFVGLLQLPARREAGAERVALGLDLATVAVVTFMFVWYLVALPTIHGSGGIDAAVALTLAYPLMDMILVLGIARVLLRRRSGSDNRAALWFLVGATSVFALADVTYARLDLAGTYSSGTLPDGLWVVALLLVALAALAQLGLAPPAVPFSGKERTYTSVSKLPYAAMVFGLGLVLYITSTEATGPLAILVLCAVSLAVLVVVRQLTVLHDNDRLAGELHRLATTDPLTQLANRRHFFDVAQQMLERSSRGPSAAVMIDLDRFKDINDGYGHASGDRVLREVARRCGEVVRPTDLLARYGGDELVALFVGARPDEVAQVAARLREHVAATPVDTPAGPVHVTLNIGVGAAPQGAPLDELLRAADLALYRAKAGGRDTVAGKLVGADLPTP
jgi:diguanylate cyclase (GGDEF)-like protein